MLSAILWGAGLVLVIEGLVFALAPSRLEDLLRVLANIPVETRRIIGFVALCLGAVLISLASGLGG
ncbi:MAG: hypothetical protein ACI8TF_001114 [Paracoccaceae bacterium]|jgi:uncharacterized protein YjeT (DUF2065 family)